MKSKWLYFLHVHVVCFITSYKYFYHASLNNIPMNLHLKYLSFFDHLKYMKYSINYTYFLKCILKSKS